MCHPGARICVMGGGPNLKADIEGIKADVWISCNEHGAKVRPVDYVVAMDNLHTVTRVPMLGHVRQHTDAPIIGPWHWCDYGLNSFPLHPRLLYSGVVAQWVASLMGAHPLIMAGFDCYGGAARAVGQHREYAPHVRCEVRVASGPLTAIWKPYSAAEKFAPYVRPDVIEGVDMTPGIRVQVLKPIEIRGRQWPKGAILTVPRQEVWRQIKHRSLAELEGQA